MKFLRFSLATLISVPLLCGLLMGIMDYNRFIQFPYWTLFTICYVTSEFQFSVCKPSIINSVQQWAVRNWNWKLEDLKPDSIVPVPELSAKDFSYKNLEKMSKGFTLPVVVRGLYKNSTVTKKWTSDFFVKTYGDDVILILTEGRTEFQYKSGDDLLIAGSTRPVKMKVRNAIRRMEKGEKMYIANIDTIFRRNNDLVDDLEFADRVKPWAYNPYDPYAVQMFLGFGSEDKAETTGTLMHSAMIANLFVQAQGCKRWTFVRPRHSIFLKPSLGKKAPAAKVTASPKGLPTMNLHLQQGDMLFNPPWMWHEIHNCDGFVVGVATREVFPVWAMRSNWLFTLLIEWKVTRPAVRDIVPKDKWIMHAISGVPFLPLALTYAAGMVRGPQKNPLFNAKYNPCDEHSPDGCTTSILDKVLYSDAKEEIPYLE